ncbi:MULTISPECIES: 3-hydroxyacyl-CoA dehydrogenase NAD-binding domain-containing protein [unclassified Streptomyces]|uniref:3-hydroxyacyl-CoA dehydrogenase NAD-binding domain-containing protein n=1 Tax=unclassified Streptomyces TaxID=2593676 RepID=UPI00343561E0
MTSHSPVHRVAIVGTGTIGASWATHFLVRGFDVTATDPSPTAEAALRSYVAAAWDAAASIGLAPGASQERLGFTADLRQAVADADFVQENAPERPELKVRLFADLDDATPPDSIIASSSSGITMSEIQAGCRRPERTVIGHPFNPPHIVPLVEVVGGTKTAPETVRDAMAFYASIGKKPIHLKKELPGHVANRIQAALYREVVYLVEEGVLDVADSDDAVSWGPGLRWGVMGPHLLWHLGGGEGGIQHFMDTLMPRMVDFWKDLGTPEFTPELAETIVSGVLQEANGRSVDELAAGRDAMLSALLAVRARHDTAGSASAVTVPHDQERLFVLEASGGGRLFSVNSDGSDKNVLVTGCRIPDGVAVDVAAGHVYWTNMGIPPENDGSIERVDLDGGNRTTIVPDGVTHTPKQLHFEATDRKLYWCDREGMRVMRCDLDGSGVETLVQTGEGDDDRRDETKWCVGVAVDPVGGHLYWTQKGPSDAGLGRILRAGIDLPAGQTAAGRDDIEVLFDGLPEPIDLELDLDGHMLYWTDRGDPPRGNTVNRSPMDPPGGQWTSEILLTHLMEGIGIALDPDGRHMYATDLGGSVYAAGLDGSGRKEILAAQGNLTGIARAVLP